MIKNPYYYKWFLFNLKPQSLLSKELKRNVGLLCLKIKMILSSLNQTGRSTFLFTFNNVAMMHYSPVESPKFWHKNYISYIIRGLFK